MAVDGRHIEDAENQRETGYSETGVDGIDPLVKAVQDAHKFEIDTKRLNYTMGTGFEETHKAGLLLANYSKMGGGAANSAKEKAERRAYQEAVLHALQSGDIGNFMANEIFGNMSEAEINDLVAEIEAETGMPFEDYAADILGEDAAAKLDGETLAEYRQRMLIALGSEMLDENGIKPEYKGDPLAQFILNDRRYQELMEDITPLAEVAADAKLTEEEKAKGREISSEDADAAHQLGYAVTNVELKDDARNGMDAHREDVAGSSAADMKDDGFGGFAGFANASVDGLATKPGKLDQAALTEQFNAKTGGPYQESDLALVAEADISPDTLTI